MDTGTQIGLGVLVVGALTLPYRLYAFMVAERRNKAAEDRNKAAERQARIERVSDEYRELARKIITSGFDGLQKAGVVATLENDQEFRDLGSDS